MGQQLSDLFWDIVYWVQDYSTRVIAGVGIFIVLVAAVFLFPNGGGDSDSDEQLTAPATTSAAPRLTTAPPTTLPSVSAQPTSSATPSGIAPPTGVPSLTVTPSTGQPTAGQPTGGQPSPTRTGGAPTTRPPSSTPKPTNSSSPTPTISPRPTTQGPLVTAGDITGSALPVVGGVLGVTFSVPVQSSAGVPVITYVDYGDGTSGSVPGPSCPMEDASTDSYSGPPLLTKSHRYSAVGTYHVIIRVAVPCVGQNGDQAQVDYQYGSEDPG